MLDWLTDPFNAYVGPLLVNALLELLLISAISAVVGTFVVLRGLGFIVDALSHAIFPGVVIAFLVGLNFLAGALVAALLVTAAISQTVRRSSVSEDSAIGIFFTGAFAFGVALLSSQKSYGRSLENFLFGDILGIGVETVWLTAGMGLLIVAAVGALRKELIFAAFDPHMGRAMGLPVAWLDLALYLLIAVTIVLALPAVGNVLVLAFLVTPAASARLLTDRLVWLLPLGFLFGVAASLIGIYASYYADLAGGASIVVAATLLFGLTLLLSPTHGGLAWVLARHARRSATVSQGVRV